MSTWYPSSSRRWYGYITSRDSAASPVAIRTLGIGSLLVVPNESRSPLWPALTARTPDMATGRRHRSPNLRRRPGVATATESFLSCLPWLPVETAPQPSPPVARPTTIPPVRCRSSPSRRRFPPSQTVVISSPATASSAPPPGKFFVYPQINPLIMRSGRALGLASSGPAAPALGAGATGARPRSYRPKPRGSDAWPMRTAGTDGAPGTSRRQPWPGRSPRWPDRARRQGRRAPGQPPGRRPTATSHAAPLEARPVGWVAGKPLTDPRTSPAPDWPVTLRRTSVTVPRRLPIRNTAIGVAYETNVRRDDITQTRFDGAIRTAPGPGRRRARVGSPDQSTPVSLPLSRHFEQESGVVVADRAQPVRAESGAFERFERICVGVGDIREVGT